MFFRVSGRSVRAGASLTVLVGTYIQLISDARSRIILILPPLDFRLPWRGRSHDDRPAP